MKIDKFHRMGRGKPSPQEAPPLKMNISDMMDHVEGVPIEMEEGENVPIQGIQRAVRAKIREQAARPAAGGRLARAWPAAAAAALLCATAAAAVIQWNGFAFTQGMSREERAALVAQGETAVASQYEDAAGNVYYLDQAGRETLVLAREDAADYEAGKQRAAEQAVADSTGLVDAYTMPLMPNLIQEVEVDGEGRFAQCALGNGSMILLHPQGQEGFALKAGDRVTLEVSAQEPCILTFGAFRNGAFLEEQTARAQRHSFTFAVREEGLYCFSIEYMSAGVGLLTGGVLEVN